MGEILAQNNKEHIWLSPTHRFTSGRLIALIALGCPKMLGTP
jgi:hypothetical protein